MKFFILVVVVVVVFLVIRPADQPQWVWPADPQNLSFPFSPSHFFFPSLLRSSSGPLQILSLVVVSFLLFLFFSLLLLHFFTTRSADIIRLGGNFELMFVSQTGLKQQSKSDCSPRRSWENWIKGTLYV